MFYSCPDVSVPYGPTDAQARLLGGKFLAGNAPALFACFINLLGVCTSTDRSIVGGGKVVQSGFSVLCLPQCCLAFVLRDVVCSAALSVSGWLYFSRARAHRVSV